MKEPKINFTIRVEKSLRDAFIVAAQANDRSGSLLIRDFMREYLRKNAQGDLLKDTKGVK